MKRRPTWLLVCLLLLPCAAGAAPKPLLHTETATVAGLPVKVQGGNVVVEKDMGLMSLDLGRDALIRFRAILHAYPNAHTVDMFVIQEDGVMGGTGADILYDRVKHTVTVNWSYGGGDNPEYGGTVRFTHVQEAVFAAILQAHPKGVAPNDAFGEHDNNASAWGGFQYLYQHHYGCRAFIPRGGHKRRLV